MSNLNRRWYEEDDYLNSFMDILCNMHQDAQCEIAVDLIMKTSEMIDRDYSKIVSEVGNYDPRKYKRWYDKNPNVHVAIESFRDLDCLQRAQIIDEFSEEVLNSYTKDEELF